MAIKLRKAPVFVTARSETGAFAADNPIINDTNYPPTSISLEPYGDYPVIAGTWYAGGGTVAPTDFVDIQLLTRNQKSSTASWLEAGVALGVRQNQEFVLETHGCTQVALRVLRVVCAAGTDLTIMAASSPYAI